jgi:putative flavoprotein involved in K+ transport
MNAAIPLHPTTPQHVPVIVVGGGQAGLSVSWCLKNAGIDHLVFEKNSIAHAWRDKRWDSFCLVTPNWQCTLPGFDYTKDFGGTDPYGFMVKSEIIRYVESYAASFNPPLHQGVEVRALRRHGDGHYEVDTSIGDFTADQVVVAIGGYHVPTVPRYAERLSPSIKQLQAADYRNADALPPGEVLIVGTGQSGCQLAEDLHLAGRKVHLCLGGAPRTARRYRGKDVVEWLYAMGHYDLPVDQHPLKEKVRKKANHYVTGRDGGRDIDLRKFAAEGMKLYGRLVDIRDGQLQFGGDLIRNLDNADAASDRIKDGIDEYIAKNGIDAVPEAREPPVWAPDSEPETLDYIAAGITSVIWCIGYRSDFRWVQIPVFDGEGYPGHVRGITPVPGLYFIGLSWLYTWGSGRFSGVARDAHHIVDHIRQQLSESAQIAPRKLAAAS